MPISLKQMQYLLYIRDGGPKQGTSHGLVQRGLISYRWGTDPSFGYNITDAGRRELKRLGK